MDSCLVKLYMTQKQLKDSCMLDLWRIREEGIVDGLVNVSTFCTFARWGKHLR